MKIVPHLILPFAFAVVFLWWSLTIFQAAQLIEMLLIASLVAAFILTTLAIRAIPLSGFLLSIVSSVVLFFLWSLLWATAEEGYIHYCVPLGSAEDGMGKSRYIYPGHSGMGDADGFMHYSKNLLPILGAGLLVGITSGSFAAIGRSIKRRTQTAEQCVRE